MTLRSRVAVALVVGTVAATLFGAPASAHVEVHADKTQAGAEDVTLTFTGEAESSSAGIASERVVLPTGVPPAGVTLVKAPTGWKFTTGPDGFTVAGPALKTGQDAVFAVKLARLPADAPTLSFKTLETYGDGQVVRWIDLPQPGQPEPDHPAPTITLKGAAQPVSAAPSSGAAPTGAATTAAAPAVTTSAPAAAPAAGSSSSGVGWWVLLAVVVVVALTGVLLWRRRSRQG